MGLRRLSKVERVIVPPGSPAFDPIDQDLGRVEVVTGGVEAKHYESLMENSPPTPRRWWKRLPVRLSLRALMFLVLVLGGGLGWVVHRAHVQRDAVAAVMKAHGHIGYEWEYKDD